MNKTLSTLVGASALAVGVLGASLTATPAQALNCPDSGGFGVSSISGAPEPDFCLETGNNFGIPGTTNFLNTTAPFSTYNPWNFIAKANAPSNTPDEGDAGAFSLTNNGSLSGTLTFLKTFNTPLVIGLKFASFTHYYLWEAPPSSIAANTVYNWTTSQGLSHVELYQGVPEPLTLLGSGIALGFGAFMKRKMDKAKMKG